MVKKKTKIETPMPTKAEKELIDSVMEEMERSIWGDNFNGDPEEYEWLLKNYKVTEDDDVRWLDINVYFYGDPEDKRELDDEEQQELTTFLQDESQVCTFLIELLRKYRSNTVTYNAADCS